jgi:hypothetical protein
MILSIAVAFLVKDGLSCGFLRGERTAMAMCCVGLTLLSGPVSAIITIVLLVLVLRRALRCQRAPLQQPVRLYRMHCRC